MGGKVCWLARVWKVTGCRKTKGKQRCSLSLGGDDIKPVLLMCGFRLPQRCIRDLGSSGTLLSVDW